MPSRHRRRPVPHAPAVAPAFHPAGEIAAEVLPGTITATLRVGFAGSARPTIDGAAVARNLEQALRDPAVGDGRARVDGPVTARVAPLVVPFAGRPGAAASFAGIEIVVPLRVVQAIPQRDLSRAFARAVYWSTAVAYPGVGAIPRPATDGGATIQALVERWPRIAEVGNTEHRGEFAAQFVVVPRAATTPAQPTAPPVATAATITLPALGVPASRLTRPQIMRFQQILTAAGFDTRGTDGVIGANTRAAVTTFQRTHQRSNNDLPARTRDFLGRVEPLGIDGDLGPRTQQALTWLAMPVSEGGGGLAVGAAPTPATLVRPAPAPPSPSPTPVRPVPPTPVRPVQPAPPPSQAAMGAGSITVFAVGAAAVGLVIAYRDRLFGERRVRPLRGKAGRD